jgi:hypothetical protein
MFNALPVFASMNVVAIFLAYSVASHLAGENVPKPL